MGDVAPGAGLARRDFLRVGGMLAAGLSTMPLFGACASIGRSRTDFNVEEATIVDIQVAMTAGRLDSESLVQIYLQRIQELDRTGPMLRAVRRSTRTRSPSPARSTPNGAAAAREACSTESP